MKRSKHSLMWLVATLNLAGLTCLCAVAGTRDPLAWQSPDTGSDVSAVLGSIGFTLMLPGSFFAASTFLCAHVLVQTEAVARMVWYITALLINLMLAWRFGAPYEAARNAG